MNQHLHKAWMPKRESARVAIESTRPEKETVFTAVQTAL